MTTRLTRTRNRREARTRTRTARAARPAAALAALALLPALLGGCGLHSGSRLADDVEPGSVGRGRPLQGAHLTVTSKEFSESIILGHVMGIAFEAAGADVQDRTGIQGSIGTREAIKSGDADAMYEYTGTGWITYLGHDKPVVDPYEQWKAVRDADRRNGVAWLPPAELDNTYALALNEAHARRYGTRTLSDVAALAKRDPEAVTVCVGNEFAVRDDGLPGMAEAYGLDLPSARIRKMDDGIIYTQVAKGRACAFGEVATTDGRIPALGLKVLEDDRHFFPNYNAAPEIHAKTLERYPAIADVLAPITKKLTNEVASRLNARVDVDGEDPHDVARDWLVEEGFVRNG
ncbi:glycine betaine ABC transporter substrate-binding protein [Streptomyces sp. B1866]|uniref:glycine betaine ABC transporter substrate-binding protein n=1 Tax=Streptomyces sp. B1866 TaxID=3075431 RepID=UPI002890917C|nr:glycine betaine ABC transporter substrate-binding protein [Streptomyces sp. B1866]MDT3396908.1 glycine betaine ABC transporter substrate-binding protein [Streptomyces sp. B1866]